MKGQFSQQPKSQYQNEPQPVTTEKPKPAPKTTKEIIEILGMDLATGFSSPAFIQVLKNNPKEIEPLMLQLFKNAKVHIKSNPEIFNEAVRKAWIKSTLYQFKMPQLTANNKVYYVSLQQEQPRRLLRFLPNSNLILLPSPFLPVQNTTTSQTF